MYMNVCVCMCVYIYISLDISRHTHMCAHTCKTVYTRGRFQEKLLQDRAQPLPTPRRTTCPKRGWWGPCAKVRVKLALRDLTAEVQSSGFRFSASGSWGFRADALSLAEILDQVVQGVLKAAGVEVDVSYMSR